LAPLPFATQYARVTFLTLIFYPRYPQHNHASPVFHILPLFVLPFLLHHTAKDKTLHDLPHQIRRLSRKIAQVKEVIKPPCFEGS